MEGCYNYAPIEGDERPYQCVKCKMRFKQRHHAQRHFSIHVDARPFSCEKCGLSFKANHQLVRHKMNHSGERPHKCKDCQIGFKTEGDLMRHNRVHNRERAYKCDICGRAFTSAYRLGVHQKGHGDIAPHVCPECQLSFRDEAALKKHSEMHDTLNKNMCTVCNAGFITRNALIRHNRRYHSEPLQTADTLQGKQNTNHTANVASTSDASSDSLPSADDGVELIVPDITPPNENNMEGEDCELGMQIKIEDVKAVREDEFVDIEEEKPEPILTMSPARDVSPARTISRVHGMSPPPVKPAPVMPVVPDEVEFETVIVEDVQPEDPANQGFENEVDPLMM